MKQEISYKNIWRVSFPIILSSTAQNIVNAIDTAFIGQLGDVAVGAAGNSIIFYYIFVVAGMGFAIGGEILVGRKNGEGNFLQIGKIIDHCCYTLLPLSFILFLILKFVSPAVLGEVTQSPNILSTSISFLSYRSFGIFFAFSNLIFRILFIGITNTRVLILSTFFMALVNVIFDYLLIFGHFGFPKMEIEGAALASVISEAATTLYFIMYCKRNNSLSKYGLFKFKKFQKTIFVQLAKISSPTMIQSFLAVASWMAFFLIIEKIGERALAISHIARSIYMVLTIPLFGFSAATSTLVSNVIGQGDTKYVLQLIKKSVVLSLLSMSIIFPVIFLFPHEVLSIYTQDLSLIEEALPVLKVISFAMFFFAIGYTLFSGVSGTGKTMVSLLIETFTLMIYLCATFLIGIKYNCDIEVVWYVEFIYFGVMSILSYSYLKWGNWRNTII